MGKIAIIYWSGTGNTKIMAEAILDGASSAGADVSIFEVTEITAENAKTYDKLMLGCPSMGAEVLEEVDFEPFYESLKKFVSGKKVALFGSYGWGDGEWMRNWQEDASSAGASVYQDGLMVNETPSSKAIEDCKEYGKGFAAF